ncbi:protein O-mannosyl-transferase family [Marinifilum sp.]|uniref:protein O-mannosyl-transferase family n=1 Tax=Marinifilum sp. TaxID=2033137 RepID=UPI003BAD7A61
MSKYQKINVLVGWLSFAIAAIVYFLSLEPTVSFWDCGEFITASYKLEIGHPPGAPFFMVLARFFALFAGGTENVAHMINALSGMLSAFTILFLFWTITHLAQKLISNSQEPSEMQIWKAIAAGFIGAMAYTFSDTFWFSAVEGEVYATSSLFTAVVFWCILKWENESGKAYANRWIILIAYLMGLSIGVHLLNLLAIPAIVMVYYFKNYTPTRNGIIKALGLSVLLLGGAMYVIIPGVVKLAFLFDLFFVNVIGLPFNSGLIIFILVVIATIVWGIRYTINKQKILANTVLMAFTVVLIGYSSYALIMIRSNANPSLDQNNPEDLHTLLSYLNREQYGDTPLIYGQYFNAPLDQNERYVKDKNVYIKKDGKYVISYEKKKANFKDSHKSIFPRMHTKGMSGKNPVEYAKWTGVDPNQKEKPSFLQNLKFFFSYQVNYMYVRYFMWNFVGRQSDKQSYGGVVEGNWISGIPFIDNMRLGDQALRPDHMKNNRGNNKYYFLPFLLGIAGLLYQYRKNKTGQKDFWVIMLLFVFTGLAIVLYLNQPPLQPRERDYAYAGSFYAFAIWIGLGFLAVLEACKRVLKSEKIAVPLVFVLCCAAVPVLMAQQNWDDHDRSGRYLARDMAYNYLNSCEPNAILFTMGDNDTFPLWYLQEVEGVRTDVRVCNLSYLSTDWYIDQMKQQNYDSAPLPISMPKEKYLEGKRDVVYLVDDPRLKAYVEKNNGLDIKEALDYVLSDKKSTKTIYGYDERIDHFPASKFRMEVDKKQILKTGAVSEKDADLIVDQMQWEVKANHIEKSGLALYNMLVENNWKRPMYFAITVPSSGYFGLENYFQLEGFAYRLVPIETINEDGQVGRVNVSKMYTNLLEKFKWGNIEDPNVYLDETCSRMTMSMRNNYLRLAESFMDKGKRDSAVMTLDKCMEIVPNKRVPLDYWGVLIAKAYYRAAEYEKANQIIEEVTKRLVKELNYYANLKPVSTSEFPRWQKRNLYLMQELYQITDHYEQTDLNEKIEFEFKRLLGDYKKG